MQDLWPPTKRDFIVVTGLVIVGYLLSLVIDGSVATIIIAVTAVLSYLGDRRGEADSDSTDSPGPAVEPSTGSYRLKSDPEIKDSDLDTGTDDDSHSSSERSDTDIGRQSSLRQSNDSIVAETEDRLRDYLTFYDDGTIQIENDDQFNMYSRMMLYVLAKRLAHEDQIVDTPNVTGDELLNRFGYTKVDLMLFLDEAGNRLNPSYSLGYRTGNVDYATIENIEISVDIPDLANITDWTVGEQQTTQRRLQSKVSHAMTPLQQAQGHCENAADRDVPATSEGVARHVQKACEAVQQYPVEVGYDGHWKSFSRYAEALLDFLEDDLVEKTTHCVPRMERALQNMKNQAQAENLV